MKRFEWCKRFLPRYAGTPIHRYAILGMFFLSCIFSSPILHAQVSVESKVPSDSSLVFPAVGGEIFYVDDEQNLVNFYKLIPVGNGRDEEKLASYLATILRDANAKVLGDITVLETILGFIYYDEMRTSYVFISSKSEEIVTKEPYLNAKTGDIWFDMEGIIPDTAEFVSVWAFAWDRSDDFRVVIKIRETVRLEMGRNTLLPEEFKPGKPYEKTHGPFKIHAFGEYYAEPFIQILPQEEDSFTTVDFKSYSDSVAVSLGGMFGFRYELVDSTREGIFTFKTIRPTPTEGASDAGTEFFEERECVFDEVEDLIWEIENADELLPGVWTMQIMDEDEVVFEKKFFISTLPAKTK